MRNDDHSGESMPAVWYERVGPADEVLVFGSVPRPDPGPGEVRVRVRTSGVNPSDTKRRAGWIGLRMPHPRIIPHSDGAGEIDAVGAGIDPSRIGERVWLWNAQGPGRPFGTAAGWCALPGDQAVPLPPETPFDVGAGLGVPGSTAHYALYADGPIGGRSVVVQGGAGAVGHLAVQLATLGGARVIATASTPEKVALARAAGADEVIPYRDVDVVERVLDLTNGAGVDRIIEVDLGANLTSDVEILAVGGTIASYSSTSDPEPILPYYPLAFKDARIHFVQGYLLPSTARRDANRDLSMWLAAGQLDVRIAARHPLARTADAHRALETGAVGKVIVTLDDG